MSSNPSEIVTIIIEDYVRAAKGLTKLFTDAGLLKFWYPLSEMPTNGRDWPSVTEMVAKNHRLLVFTSDPSKEAEEGIAFQWRYLLENERKFLRNLMNIWLPTELCSPWGVDLHHNLFPVFPVLHARKYPLSSRLFATIHLLQYKRHTMISSFVNQFLRKIESLYLQIV